MSETLPSLTANGQKLIDRLLTLPQGWVTAAMLAESIGVSRRTVLRELPSVEQWIAAAGYHFVRSPGQGLLLDEPPARREQMRALLNGSTIYAEGLKVPVGSTVGAGDSVVAALAYAESQDMSEEDAVRLSTATGAANVMCSGTQAAERSVIEELLPKVRFSKL